jgi:hypothetical protein
MKIKEKYQQISRRFTKMEATAKCIQTQPTFRPHSISTSHDYKQLTQ